MNTPAVVLAAAIATACAKKQSFAEVMGVDVAIESVPPGALVTEGERTVGTTPTRIDVQDRQTHRLAVQRPGFHATEIVVDGAEAAAQGGGLVVVALAPESFEARRIDANDAGQLVRAGSELVARGRAADAIPFYRRALAIAPENAPAWRGLGSAYAKLGKRDAALDAWRQYLLLAPPGKEADAVRKIVEKSTTGFTIRAEER